MFSLLSLHQFALSVPSLSRRHGNNPSSSSNSRNPSHNVARGHLQFICPAQPRSGTHDSDRLLRLMCFQSFVLPDSQGDSSFIVLCSSTKTSLNPTLSESVSSPEKAELEHRRRFLEVPNNGGRMRNSGRVHKHTPDKSRLQKHELQKKHLENLLRDWRRVAEDDGGSVIKEVGSNLNGSSGNGFSTDVHARCSTKCVAYGGNIPAIFDALDTIEDVDEALRPWKKTLSNKERSIILKEQRSWERALEIFERLKRNTCYELNVIHYTIMLRILGKARKWDHVEQLWDEMMAKGFVPSIATYGTLIDVYSKGGRVKEALLWLERMNERGMEPNEVIMGTVVQLYKKAGQFDKAEDFFKKWLSRASLRHKDDVATRNVCLTSRTYNILIDLYGKAGKLEEAFNTFSKMVDQGVKPTTVTFTTLIHIYGDHGELDVVTFLMQKMKELQCPPNTTTYNTLIDMYGKAGKIEEASKKFSSLLKEGVVPTTLTFNTMMNICGEHGRLNAATFLMQKMKMFHCPPDTITYNILIKLHAKHDDINRATSYFRKMEEAGLEPDTMSYLTLLHAYSARHMVRNTEALIAKMDRRGVEGIDEFTQAALTRMYIETGMLDKSWKWFMRFHLAENMSSEWYSGIIDAYAEHGHISEAEEVFKCCKEGKKLGVLVCNVMIKAYGIGNKCYEACQFLDDMTSQGIVPDRSTYGSLIHILASAEMPHVATPYLRKMQEAGLVRDCAPYCAVIVSFVKLGQLELAEGLYKEMVGCNVQPDAMLYGVLIKALADAGRVKEAIHYVIAMGSAGLDVDTNEILITLFSKLPTQETCKVL